MKKNLPLLAALGLLLTNCTSEVIEDVSYNEETINSSKLTKDNLTESSNHQPQKRTIYCGIKAWGIGFEKC